MSGHLLGCRADTYPAYNAGPCTCAQIQQARLAESLDANTSAMRDLESKNAELAAKDATISALTTDRDKWKRAYEKAEAANAVLRAECGAWRAAIKRGAIYVAGIDIEPSINLLDPIYDVTQARAATDQHGAMKA